MKTRTGFVSNSSSSSFIVAVKKSDKCPHCGRTDPDFIDLIETIGGSSDGYECTKLRARGAEQVFQRIEKENFEWCDDAEKKAWEKRFGDWLKAEEKGYAIADIEISYHDEATSNLFQDLRERKAVLVLWSDHEGPTTEIYSL